MEREPAGPLGWPRYPNNDRDRAPWERSSEPKAMHEDEAAKEKGAQHSVGVARAFVAQHYLVGGDFGAENRWHSHPYRVEVTVLGAPLDRHDFLVDITRLERELDALLARYRDHTLNDLPELLGRNPSVELLAQHIGDRLACALAGCGGARLRVRLWESETAWAGFSRDL